MKITIIGAGYVGLLTGTVLAAKNNHQFHIVDVDEKKIENLKNGNLFIKEKDFAKYFNQVFEKNLFLSTSYKETEDADIVFISVCTPSKNGKCDLSFFWNCVDNLKIKDSAILIVKSTVPIGTTTEVKKRFPNTEVYNIPEFLAEGTAIDDLLNPVRVLIGSANENDSKVEEVLDLFRYVPSEKIFVTDSNTSELSKLASNFILAERVATINVLDTVAKEHHANINHISQILRMDDRIGSKFLSPSAGFGGSCFKKDVENLSSICGNTMFSKFIGSINSINSEHMILVVDEIEELKPKRVLFLGYGFKEFTEDKRESPTQFIINFLKSNIEVQIFDPHIEEFSKDPIGDFEVAILMNNEQVYKDLARKLIEKRTKIINPRHIQL